MITYLFNLLRGNVIYLLIGLLSAFCVRVLGIITIGEILIVLFVICTCLFKRFNIIGYHRLVNKWLLALSSAILFSGIYTNSTNYYIKGVITIFLLYFSFQFFATILARGNRFAIIAFLLGYSISNILVSFVFISFSDLAVGERAFTLDEFQEDMYAYIYFPTAYLINAMLFEKHRGILIIVNFALALAFLFGGSRTSFLVLLLTDVFLIFNYFKAGKIAFVRSKTLVKFSFVIVICLTGALKGYSYLASHGYLGEGAQLKYEIQSSLKGGIASSRSYFLRGLITIAHHPFGAIGFQQIPDDNFEIRQEYAKLSGTKMRFEDPNCAAHSSMLDWWIYFGILTVPFWLYILKKCLFACRIALVSNNINTAVALLCCFQCCWNVFFSPFSNRIMWGFQILVVLFFIHTHISKQNENRSSQV